MCIEYESNNDKKDLNKKTNICKCCKEEKSIEEFFTRNNQCKVCYYLEKGLEIKENWTTEEYKIILDNLLNKKIYYINEIIDKLNNKSLDDLLDLLSSNLIIKSNVPVKIKCVCNNQKCNKVFGITLSKYLKGKGKYCSFECAKQSKRNDYNCKEGFSRCGICNREKPIKEFMPNIFLKREKTYTHCKTCEWFRRNKNKYNLKEEWTIEEYRIIVDNILNEKITYINDILPMLNNKTLDDLANLLKKDLIIRNKPIDILVNCSYCDKKYNKINYVKVNLAKYFIQNNFFCNRECYHNYKKEFEVKGKEHPYYKRVKTKCSNCGKNIDIIPYSEERNHHNFCCQECYWEFRSKYYVGDKANRVKFTPEIIEKMRIATTKLYAEGVFNRQTIPQKIINEILLDLNIKSENEYNCKYYSIDNYLPEYNLMIEVMGDYFHGNPLTNSYLNHMQKKDIVRDKRKHTYIKKYYNIEVLYLWETDIKEYPEKCIKLILEYVLNDGVLKNYNSFNYKIYQNDLILSDNIIKPYMEYDIKDLNNITKTSEEYEKMKLIKKMEYYTTCNCGYCNKQILVLKSRKKVNKIMFCNKECINNYYKDKHIIVNCKYCGKEIDMLYKDKNKVNNHFCNKECLNNYLKKDAIIVQCDNCGKDIQRNKQRVNSQKHNFCDKKCYADFRKKQK